MSRPFLLLLLLVPLSSAAPIDRQIADLTARKFWGELFTAHQYGTQDEVFDLIYRKWDHFFPGLITTEEASNLYNEAKEYNNGERESEFSEESEQLLRDVEKELFERLDRLEPEAKLFLEELVEELGAVPDKANGTFKIRHLGKVLDKLKVVEKSVEQLPDSARIGLVRNFPVFGKLEELKALITVASRIFGSLVKMCKDLPGFPGCDGIHNM